MATTERQVYGWWVISDQQNGSEVHRVAGHDPKGSVSHDRAEMGLFMKVDFDRFIVKWEDAP